MKRLFIILILGLSILCVGCKKSLSPLIYEDDSAKLRIINMAQHPQTFFININKELLVDTLQCNRSSGYIKIKSDSVQVEIFDRFNNSSLLYDTLVVLASDEFFTLIVYKSDDEISSLLVNDSAPVNTEITSIRIFNNSEVGEPFTFFMKSSTDTISFISPQLYKLSSYKQLVDTLYTPVLKIISVGISADYQNINLNRSNNYTFIITDTYSITHEYYPYVCFVFLDIFDNREIQRL